MRVRVATPRDIDALVALEQVCEGPDAWSLAFVAEGVEGRLPTTTWLVTDDLCGYAVVAVMDDLAELQRIGVAPDSRRTGIATTLLADVVARARRAGALRVLLEVREGNEPALALYARAGFTEIARRSRYYADGATAVVMQAMLGDPVADQGR